MKLTSHTTPLRVDKIIIQPICTIYHGPKTYKNVTGNPGCSSHLSSSLRLHILPLYPTTRSTLCPILPSSFSTSPMATRRTTSARSARMRRSAAPQRASVRSENAGTSQDQGGRGSGALQGGAEEEVAALWYVD